jgi:predicted patatin/cPLA2 family phospholipase
LSLDGGGLRGMMTLQVLKKIEKLLQDRFGDTDMRLCDYFDLIAGTSTGAIHRRRPVDRDVGRRDSRASTMNWATSHLRTRSVLAQWGLLLRQV